MGEPKKNERRKEIENVIEQAQTVSPSEFSNWGFRRPVDIPGLQCVDLLAWSTYQYSLLGYGKVESLHPFAKVAWEDFKQHNDGKWGYFVWMKPDNLRKWVHKAMVDGASMSVLERGLMKAAHDTK